MVAQVLFGGLVAVIAYCLSVSRLCRLAGVSFTTVVCPFNIGEPPWMLTYGMMYNRIGYALLGLILIEAMAAAKPGTGRMRSEMLGGAATGFMCSFLLFLKITYGLVGIAVVIALLGYRRQIRQRFMEMAIAGLPFTLLVLAYLRFNVPALIRELRLAAGGKHMPRLNSIGAAMTVVASTITVVSLALLVVWLFSVINHSSLPLSRPWAAFLAALFGFALLITNNQSGGQPLNAFVCVLIASEIARYSIHDWESHQAWLATHAALLVVALCAPFMRLAPPAVRDFRSRDITPPFRPQRQLRTRELRCLRERGP